MSFLQKFTQEKASVMTLQKKHTSCSDPPGNYNSTTSISIKEPTQKKSSNLKSKLPGLFQRL